MTINYIFRSPLRGEYSIENVFENVIPYIENSGNSVYRSFLPYERYNSVKYLISNLIFIRKQKGDILHITGEIYFFSLFTAKKKTVLTIHDFVLLENSSKVKYYFYKFFWYYLPIKFSERQIFISEKTYKEACRLFPHTKISKTIIYNSFNKDIYKPSNNLRKTKKNIIVVGTRKNKNVERIILAVKNSDYRLIIVGKLSDEQSILLMENEISYVNYCDISNSEMFLLYCEADILCFPSLFEGFGLPIIEAQAVGRPVITSNISPMNEVAGGAALLVDPKSISCIRKSIDTLLNDNEIYREYVVKGFENTKRFTQETISSEYLKVYESMKT